MEQTKNARGFMHPLSMIEEKFVDFSAVSDSPVIDMGCAYGNTVIAALQAGAKKVIACDMEQEHLEILKTNIQGSQYANNLITIQGVFPDSFDFDNNSISAIHFSHLLEYLNGNEIEKGFAKCFQWLKPGGKIFILTYSIYILELANDKFINEYQRRLDAHVKWPGYLENYDDYSILPSDKNDDHETPPDEDPFPSALHMFDLTVLKNELTQQGFLIEFANYLDGKTNGADKITWNDGREYIGIVAVKPDSLFCNIR